MKKLISSILVASMIICSTFIHVSKVEDNLENV